MSARFIAHVERPDGRVHHIDCDAAHENDAGCLALTVNTYVGAIAAYAPGAWASYRLEAAPEPVTEEQLMSGEKSLNDYRRSLGFHASCAVAHTDHQGNPIPCPDAAPGSDAFSWPAVGDKVHVWLRDHGCLASTVDAHVKDAIIGGDMVGLGIRLDRPFGDAELRVYGVYSIFDPTMQLDGSWHYPHDDEPADSEPEGPNPVNVSINVHGTVVAERQLRDLVERLILQRRPFH